MNIRSTILCCALLVASVSGFADAVNFGYGANPADTGASGNYYDQNMIGSLDGTAKDVYVSFYQDRLMMINDGIVSRQTFPGTVSTTFHHLPFADLDSDGTNEILCVVADANNNSTMYALDNNVQVKSTSSFDFQGEWLSEWFVVDLPGKTTKGVFPYQTTTYNMVMFDHNMNTLWSKTPAQLGGVPQYPYPVTSFYDLDQDGQEELLMVMQTENQPDYWVRNIDLNTGATITDTTHFDFSLSAWNFIAQDLLGDGSLCLCMQQFYASEYSDGHLVVFNPDLSVRVNKTFSFTDYNNVFFGRSGNFVGDAALEFMMLVENKDGSQALVLMDGMGNVTGSTPVSVGTSPTAGSYMVNDFDGDGILEVFTMEASGLGVYKASGTAFAQIGIIPGATGSMAKIAQLNGGSKDILCYSVTDGSPSTLSAFAYDGNNGAVLFQKDLPDNYTLNPYSLNGTDPYILFDQNNNGIHENVMINFPVDPRVCFMTMNEATGVPVTNETVNVASNGSFRVKSAQFRQDVVSQNALAYLYVVSDENYAYMNIYMQAFNPDGTPATRQDGSLAFFSAGQATFTDMPTLIAGFDQNSPYRFVVKAEDGVFYVLNEYLEAIYSAPIDDRSNSINFTSSSDMFAMGDSVNDRKIYPDLNGDGYQDFIFYHQPYNSRNFQVSSIYANNSNGADQMPPTGIFDIPDLFVATPNVNANVTFTDTAGVPSVYFSEMYHDGSGYQVGQDYGWRDMAPTQSFALTDQEGSHRIYCWPVDGLNNVAASPSLDVVNVCAPDHEIVESIGYVVYEIPAQIGDSFTITTTVTAGDVNLYLWEPNSYGAPDSSSENAGLASDQVTVAPQYPWQEGIYYIGCYATASMSVYTASIASGGGSIAGMKTGSNRMDAPTTRPDGRIDVVRSSTIRTNRTAADSWVLFE